MKKLHARKIKPKKKGIGKNPTRKQFPQRRIEATVSDPDDRLNLWFTFGLGVAFDGHGSRNCKWKAPRRWWGHKQTQWIRSSETGRMVRLFNDRH